MDEGLWTDDAEIIEDIELNVKQDDDGIRQADDKDFV